MSQRSSIRTAVDSAIGTALGWLVIGLFNTLFWLLMIVVTPFVMIRLALQRCAPGVFGAPDEPDPADVAAFEAIWDDLNAGDIAALRAHAARDDSFPHGVDPFIGRHWLTNAVDTGVPVSARWILDQGVDPNYQDDEGFSPLMSAIGLSDHPGMDRRAKVITEMLTLLLDAGADPNFRVTLDRTALHAAACRAAPEVIRFLLERGANPHAYDRDYVPARPIDDARSLKRHAAVAVLDDWMAAHPAPTPD